jgi:hypothetical protein
MYGGAPGSGLAKSFPNLKKGQIKVLTGGKHEEKKNPLEGG